LQSLEEKAKKENNKLYKEKIAPEVVGGAGSE
jgi:hypothetical protein